ncbi:MAG: rhomboid family intramembrane serine protease [Bacteroides sp.]|nr:rhomboid family intramembrane serine protease [Bacteroides sp.]
MIKDKLRFIFLPFFLCAIGILIGYTFLHWLLIIRLDLFQPQEIYLEFVFPGIICTLIGCFYLRRKIKLFYNPRPHDFYTILCVMGLLVPTMIAQSYLMKQQGRLIEMDTPDKIDSQHQVKYYSIENSVIPKAATGAYVSRSNADRHGNKIMITVYFVTPLLTNPDLGELHTHNNWIATSFKRKFSNTAFDDKEIQKKEIQEFINEAFFKFERYPFTTKYLVNLRTDNNWNHYLSAAQNSNHYVGKENIVILEEIIGEYETRTGNSFVWIFRSLAIANLIWLLITLFTPVFEGDMRIYRLPASEKKTLYTKFTVNWRSLYSLKFYWATSSIIFVNIVVFILLLFDGIDLSSPQADELIKWGASFGPLIREGEWWRLFTCIFLHAGVVHLVYNMLSLALIGWFTEREVGSFRFFLIYLLTGIAGSYCSFLFHESTVSVGASGAIFGMYGLGAALSINRYFSKDTIGILLLFGLPYMAINLIYGLLVSDIDMSAHLGGMACGFVIGLLFFSFRKKRIYYRKIIDRYLYSSLRIKNTNP